MEGDARDDVIIPQIRVEGDANIMEESIANDSLKPSIGMEFLTHEDAYAFYNRYALQTGFGIRRFSTNASRSDKNLIISRKYVCCKEGFKKLKNKEGVSTEEAAQDVHNRDVRTGCNAMMKINLATSNTWKVTIFIEKHDNHELSTPSKTTKHRSHKKVHRKETVKQLMSELHDEGIPNSGIAKVVNVFESTQHDFVTPQQVHDHLRIARKNNIGRNCGKIIKHFQEKKANDSEFYFSLEVSEDFTLRSVFWADGRSRESYMKFSDVIIFDVTYRTNNFSLPFAPFTGINHHRQSTLFGCALLADETEETFVWLSQQWLKCMHNRLPGAIITDQDAAMGNAIAIVFPNVRHRYCDWHMDKNIGEHLVRLKATHGVEFELYFNRLRGSDSISEAEECWNELMAKYKLPEKSWIPKLWDRRESWMSCYLKDIFLAGTRTSQRAESINSFFDSFVNASTALHEFVIQYDKALVSRRVAEENADFDTMNSTPVPTTGWQVEQQAGRCYTKALFVIFNKELKDSLGYWFKQINQAATTAMFIAGRPQSDERKWKRVTYDDSEGVTVSCECQLFEFTGILCRHALNILWNKHVTEIPDRYILKRWTIDARYQRVSVELSDSAPTKGDQILDMKLQYIMKKARDEAHKSPAFGEEVYTLISKMLEKVVIEPVLPNELSQVLGRRVDSTTTIPEITVRDPTECVKTKGRPRVASRLQSGLELSQAESRKKQRTCGFCGEKGHYKTGCAKAKASAPATTSDHNILDCSEEDISRL